jgi:hypothetical protein
MLNRTAEIVGSIHGARILVAALFAIASAAVVALAYCKLAAKGRLCYTLSTSKNANVLEAREAWR